MEIREKMELMRRLAEKSEEVAFDCADAAWAFAIAIEMIADFGEEDDGESG